MSEETNCTCNAVATVAVTVSSTCDVFVDKDGKRRRGIEKICPSCNIKFVTRIDKEATYCSIKCSGIGKRNRVTLTCSYCFKKFEKSESKLLNSKSGIYFCSRNCKDIAQRIGGIKEIQPPHFGSSNGKQLCKRLRKDNIGCVTCGLKNKLFLQVHHIDGNRENNTKENLEVVWQTATFYDI